MAPALRATALSIMVATLGACGSGGGGGGSTVAPAGSDTPPPSGGTPPPQQGGTTPPAGAPNQNSGGGSAPRVDVPFTQFSAVQANQRAIMSGSATTINGTQTRTGNDVVVTETGPLVADGPATLALGFDKQRALTSVDITAPQGSVSFDRAAGHSISCPGGGHCDASSATASAVTGNAFQNGWNYQTFGAWATQTGPTSFVLGGVSAGNATPGNAVPTTGVFTFTGIAGGYFIDQAGIRFTTGASMIANVDFQNRSIGFSTLDTTLVNSKTGIATRNEGLDLSGGLSWNAGSNGFTGQLQSRNANVSGQASGLFYGPKAEEIGGTYNLVGGTVSRMVGGFGGKR
jgi:transferrin binding protein